MTGEEMERAIEFLINHHAKVSSDIESLKEAQKITTANIASLATQAEADRREMRETFNSMAGEMRETFNSMAGEMREGFNSLTEEMRDGFNKLILSNEITRDLANQVARLAIETSQRVTVLEDKLK